MISERDRLLAESSELGADKATRESERAALRAELREARQREQRLLLDIGDLEDENISLQKQVSALRSSQVRFILSSLSQLFVTRWLTASGLHRAGSTNYLYQVCGTLKIERYGDNYVWKLFLVYDYLF